MIAAFDVRYFDDGHALVAALAFQHFSDQKPYSVYKKRIQQTENYIPGSFYKRELPCILSLLSEIKEKIQTIIVDGYVYVGERPGLGAHLREAIDPKINVIGVAKTHFKASSAKEVFRGKSKKPLYVTAIGLDEGKAAALIRGMHGENRIPTLLKKLDRLTKESA